HLAVGVDASAAEVRQGPGQPALGLGMLGPRGVALRRDDQEARTPPSGAFADPLEQWLADDGLVGNDEDVLLPALGGDVDDDVLNRALAGDLAEAVDHVLAQPARLLLRVRCDD